MSTHRIALVLALLVTMLVGACFGANTPTRAIAPTAAPTTPTTPRLTHPPSPIAHRPPSSPLDINLPSDSTGVANGTLAVRILPPTQARYADGAPVVIFVPGGDTAGSLKPALPGAEDTVRIVFLFPGGRDPVAGRKSDGTYDHRGPASIAALRDVILFAMGQRTTVDGKTIDDLLPTPVLHDNIGLLGASNGGNIAVAVAAQYGTALRGHLRYIVQWESPVSSQMVTVDLGGVRLDCPQGKRERLDVVNPRYHGYSFPEVDVDHSQIAYNPADARHPIFLDGNGDGRYTTIVDSRTGCRTPDLNGDGVLGLDEDWPLNGHLVEGKTYYSRPATQALADHNVFTTWPANVATPGEAAAYWDVREAVRLYDDALAAISDLEAMVLASYRDHVQSAVDHPHIRQAFEGWCAAMSCRDGREATALRPYIKLNPSLTYLAQADPALQPRTDIPDLPANIPPANWNAPASYTVPEDVPPDTLQIAAIWQMADRAHARTATPPPSSTSTPPPSPPSAAPTLWQTVAINPLHGWPSALGNHLKVFDIAVDETRGRAYLQGILTAGIAVIDTATNTLTATVDSGLGLATYHRTYLAVHPDTGTIYVADYSGKTLRRVAPESGGVSASVTLSGRPTHILLDPVANRVYLTMKEEHRIAVYDATSLALVKEVGVSPAAPLGMILDTTGSRLYVVDSRPPRAGRSHLLVLNTATLALETPLTFANPTNRPPVFVDLEPASGDLFVTTPEDLFRLAPSGAVRWRASLPDNAKAPFYWAVTGKVYLVSRNGISPVRSTLAVVDAVTGTVDTVVDLGLGGVQRAAFDHRTGTMYATTGEFTALVIVDARTYQVTKTLDLGNSVEDIAVAADGTAYFANRLGGSTVIAYRADTGEWNEFIAGGWPTGVDVDPALNRLFVLSHFDGTVSAYDLAADSLYPTRLATIPLGVQDVTDAISAQVVDTAHHRVITAHPEHDRIVIVDGEKLQVVKTIADIPSFAYRKDVQGRGHVQLAVDEARNKLYVFARGAHKVDVFDGNANYAYLRTIDLNGQPWDWADTFRDESLWMDSARGRLYVGPIIIDTATDAVVGTLPAGAGKVVVGQDRWFLYVLSLATSSTQSLIPDTRYQVSDIRYQMTLLDPQNHTVYVTFPLRPQTFVPPYFAVDAAHGRVYVGYMQAAEVDIYTWEETAPTPSPIPMLTPAPTATPGAGQAIDAAYLMAFLACDRRASNCRSPANHRVYLAQSDDGAHWSLVPDWTPYPGSVPDVIRRGDTIYVYTPGFVRRYRVRTQTWEAPVPVTLEDPVAAAFVDPSLTVDAQGRLVLFYLPGIPGQDPARCAPGQTTCVKRFRSATEVEGSDGTHFVADEGDRTRVTIGASDAASDPDIFYDGERYVLYISRGPRIQVFTSPTLRGEYTLWSCLPNNGFLTSAGGVGAGYFDAKTRQYWTYVAGQGGIRRAVHASLDRELTASDFSLVLNGNTVGLGPTYIVGSPGIAANTPGLPAVRRIMLPLIFHML